MKKILLVLVFLFTLCFLTSCTEAKKHVEIYSFSGSNNQISINNGLIVTAPDGEKFIGGDLTLDTGLTGVQSISERFYYFRDGEEITIQENMCSIIEGMNDKGMSIIKEDTGSTFSKELFYENDLEQIKQSLNFSASGTFISGEAFEYKIILDVKKTY